MSAVVLSGGGARGIAHLGVLQALNEVPIKISAIFGAFYASGIAH